MLRNSLPVVFGSFVLRKFADGQKLYSHVGIVPARALIFFRLREPTASGARRGC